MISNSKVDKLTIETCSYIQASLNRLEEYIEEPDANAPKIGFEIGKLHKDFQLLIELLDIKLP